MGVHVLVCMCVCVDTCLQVTDANQIIFDVVNTLIARTNDLASKVRACGCVLCVRGCEVLMFLWLRSNMYMCPERVFFFLGNKVLLFEQTTT